MKVLHVSSEVAPWSKTGGLGDVVSSLPRAQAQLSREAGDQFAVVAPAYLVDPARHGLARRLRRVDVPLGGRIHDVQVLEGQLPGGGGEVQAWLIDHPVFRRPGIYGEGNYEYPDNAFRFALLSRAALLVPRAFGFVPDVVHAHDWPTGPALSYARRLDLPAARTVFTIHNIAFQGLFPAEVTEVVDLGWEGFRPEGFEFYGRVSYLKVGLCHADRITTVSPRHAREILTPEFGFGLDGFLAVQPGGVSGILNGVDYETWNPARDPACAAPFSAARPEGKRACKAALQQAMGLSPRPRVPLFGAVSRLSWQKGFDLLADVLEQLLPEREVQVVVLGSGERETEERLKALAARHPTRLAVHIGYDEERSHRVYAGSDLFLMPSRYEPCGLGQMYALRYGAVPVVRATGGLDDTVVDFDAPSRTGTGFKFGPADAPALGGAMRRALSLFASEEDFTGLRRRGMAQDFSWAGPARAYRELYSGLLARPRLSPSPG